MIITIILLVINVAVYLLLEIIGDTESANFMLKMGGMYPYFVIEGKQYWRFLTAMFLHYGSAHLLNNMVMLGAAGRILELALGKVKFLLLYLLAGIGGGILSCWNMVRTGDFAVSAGASGAIFGIVGALLWVVIRHKGRYKTLTKRGLLIMIALCLYYGITTANVDNWGHIGGLITGFVLCIILYRKPPETKPKLWEY